MVIKMMIMDRTKFLCKESFTFFFFIKILYFSYLVENRSRSKF